MLRILLRELFLLQPNLDHERSEPIYSYSADGVVKFGGPELKSHFQQQQTTDKLLEKPMETATSKLNEERLLKQLRIM